MQGGHPAKGAECDKAGPMYITSVSVALGTKEEIEVGRWGRVSD